MTLNVIIALLIISFVAGIYFGSKICKFKKSNRKKTSIPDLLKVNKNVDI